MNPQAVMEDAWTASVVDPAQIWHMARMAVGRELIGSMPAKFGKAEREAMVAQILAIIEQSWASYVELVAISPHEREAYLQIGEPTHIRLNHKEGAPVAQWIAENPSVAGVIGELVMPADEATGRPAYRFSDVFRPVDLTALPEAHESIALTDTRHTATAAVHELGTMLIRDLDRICALSDPRGAWAAMFMHSRVLKDAAAEAIRLLPSDHYKGWNTELTRTTRLEETPALVDRHAATNTAQQRIATFYVAQCFGELIYGAERTCPADVEQRNRRVLADLRTAMTGITTHLDTYNEACARGMRLSHEDTLRMVIFRAIGHSKPMLVMIPKAVMPNSTPSIA